MLKDMTDHLPAYKGGCMKVLVTGAKGQLGKETVLALEAKGETVIAIDREELDFSIPDTGCRRNSWLSPCRLGNQLRCLYAGRQSRRRPGTGISW